MLDIVGNGDNDRLHQAFLSDVLEGLSRNQKTLPSRWLYDDRGSELFEEITDVAEYYPTRTERSILLRHAEELARFVGKNAQILEYGAGAGIKTEILLGALMQPQLYVPIDIAGDYLQKTAVRIQERFPDIETWPINEDFTTDFDLPTVIPPGSRAAFFPGSTIGNLNPEEANSFLKRVRRHVGEEGKAIIGIDLKKDLGILLPAYDDRQGITAAFNLNLLVRINRELGANFALDRFAHEARWNADESAIEMHLVSRDDQIVTVSGRSFAFRTGETIHTESSRKYDTQSFGEIAKSNGWSMHKTWTDPASHFAVVGLKAA